MLAALVIDFIWDLITTNVVIKNTILVNLLYKLLFTPINQSNHNEMDDCQFMLIDCADNLESVRHKESN